MPSYTLLNKCRRCAEEATLILINFIPLQKVKEVRYLQEVLNTAIGKMKSVFPAELPAAGASQGGTETGERIS